MKYEHTQKKWKIAVVGGEAYIVDEGGNSAQGITSVRLKNCGMNFSEAVANAILIAASPELLVVVEKLLKHEGERVTSGIGTEHDSDELEAAKKEARDLIARISSEGVQDFLGKIARGEV